MGPRNRTEKGRTQYPSRENILTHPVRTKSPPGVHQGTPAEGIHPSLEKPIRRPLLLHQKERRETPPCPGLPSNKRVDNKKPIPATPHPRTHQPSQGRHPILQVRRPMGI